VLRYQGVEFGKTRAVLRGESGRLSLAGACRTLRAGPVSGADGSVRIDDLSNPVIEGNCSLSGGRANVVVRYEPAPSGILAAEFRVAGADLEQLTSGMSENLSVTGLMDFEGTMLMRDRHFLLTVEFRSRKARARRQVFDVKAVKALMALGGGGGMKVSQTEFAYTDIAGRVTVEDEYLIFEGLAGKEGEYEYLVRNRSPFPGVNVLVHTRTNTIRLADFARRISRAAEYIAE